MKPQNTIDTITNRKTRAGLKDIWNAFMTDGAHYSLKTDIPTCPTTAVKLPIGVIPYSETKQKHNAEYFVHFYIDDYKFDGKRGIWQEPEKALSRISSYAGMITPDFSMYQDMPEPLKIYNTYRSRVFGYWIGKHGIPVINNVRWGTPDTYHYCFDGIPLNSIVSIGTVGSNLKNSHDRERFESGLFEMVRRLSPHTIIIYGSSHYECFDILKERGIHIIAFPSKTSIAFNSRKAGDKYV